MALRGWDGPGVAAGLMNAFAALLDLAERPHELNDAEWAERHEAIAASFGARLAREASRGQVRPAGRGGNNQ
jgi:hypothetical protein